jgi:hypothetical protein
MRAAATSPAAPRLSVTATATGPPRRPRRDPPRDRHAEAPPEPLMIATRRTSASRELRRRASRTDHDPMIHPR